MINSKKRVLNGYKKDSEDHRDFKFKASYGIGSLPSKVDLRNALSAVEDQKTIGSCVAQGIVGALEYHEKKNGVPYEDLSRLFLYYNTRVIQGTVREDSGCEIRLALKALSKQGICKESFWKYDCRRYRTEPPEKCYTDGLRYTNISYYRLSTASEIKSALTEGYPVVFGAELFSSFMSEEVAKTGSVQLPVENDMSEGGHCMLIVGYDDSTGRFIVRNSWGKKWGQKGYCTMPYGYIGNRNLAGDFWVVKLV